MNLITYEMRYFFSFTQSIDNKWWSSKLCRFYSHELSWSICSSNWISYESM